MPPRGDHRHKGDAVIDIGIDGTPTFTHCTFEPVSVPVQKYEVYIDAPADGNWAFRLEEWRLPE